LMIFVFYMLTIGWYVIFADNILGIVFWFILPVLIAFLAGREGYFCIRELRKKRYREFTKKQTGLLIAFYVGVILTIIFLVVFVDSIFNESAPLLFPFDDARATYTVTYDHGLYSIHYQSTSGKNYSYSCSTNGGCSTSVTGDVQSVVGKSPVDLKLLIEKHVRLKGSFEFVTKQCIVSICKNLGNYVGVDISSIKEDQK